MIVMIEKAKSASFSKPICLMSSAKRVTTVTIVMKIE